MRTSIRWYCAGSLVLATLCTVAPARAQSASGGDAQSSLTRAEVRAEVERVERNGYKPIALDPFYPAGIQAAEQRAGADAGASRPGSPQPGQAAPTPQTHP
jgi:hypothetical protein